MRYLLTAVLLCIAVLIGGCIGKKTQTVPTHDTSWMHYEAKRKEKKVNPLRKKALEEFLQGKDFLKNLGVKDKVIIDRKLIVITRKVAGSLDDPFVVASVPGYEEIEYRDGFKYVVRVVSPYEPDKHDSVICITDDNHKIYDVIVGYDN